MLVGQLPPESATATRLRLDALDADTTPALAIEYDPETEQWSRLEQLIAGIRDELHVLRWEWLVGHGATPEWKPEPLARPGVAPSATPVLHTPEQVSLLAAHLARTQGGEVAYN